ncbi:MAG: hypothetical protein WCA92_03235, partial [Terriglobales bacterium]
GGTCADQSIAYFSNPTIVSGSAFFVKPANAKRSSSYELAHTGYFATKSPKQICLVIMVQ